MTWLGGIYLKEEGGYEIVLKALNHYKNRLMTIGESPELKNSAAMFASILNQQARKTVPKIDAMTAKIQASIGDIHDVNNLQEDISFMEKSLSCYESDIHKAEDTGYEYFVKLIGDMVQARQDLGLVKTAMDKIKQFSA